MRTTVSFAFIAELLQRKYKYSYSRMLVNRLEQQMGNHAKFAVQLRKTFTAISLSLTAFAGSASASGGVCERIIITGNSQYPPVLWVDPDDSTRLTGAAVALLEKVLEGSGISVDALNMGPLARAQQELRSGRVDMLAGAFLTPDRMAEMDFVYPPFMEIPSVLFVRRGEAFPYTGWVDLRGRHGSSVANTRFGAAFDDYAKEYLDIQTVPSTRQSFELLMSKKADYVIYERHQGQALAAQMGILDQVDIVDGSLITEQLYYVVSHNSACNSPSLRAALARGMYRLEQQGEPRRIIEKYREIWASQFETVPETPPSPQ